MRLPLPAWYNSLQLSLQNWEEKKTGTSGRKPGNCGPHFLCPPSVKDHSPTLPAVQYLQTLVVYILLRIYSCLPWRVQSKTNGSVMARSSFLRDLRRWDWVGWKGECQRGYEAMSGLGGPGQQTKRWRSENNEFAEAARKRKGENMVWRGSGEKLARKYHRTIHHDLLSWYQNAPHSMPHSTPRVHAVGRAEVGTWIAKT